MNAFNELLEQIEGSAERASGRSLAEWNKIHNERRHKALRSGRISAGKIMSPEQMIGEGDYFGFIGDDVFFADWVPFEEVERIDSSFRRPTESNGRSAATGNRPHGHPSVIRYKYKPEAIKAMREKYGLITMEVYA